MTLFHKALLYQNYKQTKIVVWVLAVLFILALPIQTMFSIESWASRSYSGPDGYTFELSEFDILSIFSHGLFQLVIPVTIVLLACLLIGVERNTRRMDFTFSLPFSRRQLFLTKWLYGTIIIFVFHGITFLLAYWMMYISEFAYGLSIVTINQIYFGPIVSYILLFTFALFVGTFTGEMVSQFVLTWIFAFFPYGIIFLILYLFDIHYIPSFPMPDWIHYLNVVYYLVEYHTTATIWGVIGIILLTVLGVMIYEKNKVEHNGEFLIFKQLHPIFLVWITVYFSLFGGIVVSSIVPWNALTLRVIAYWIGFGIFFFFTFIITKRLLNMNVTVKNK